MSSVYDQIDTLADEFEKTWTSQSIHHIEKIIASIQEENRHIVFDELVLVDIELRFKNGIKVNVDGYAKQFPFYSDRVPVLYKKVMSSRQLGEYEYYENLGKGGMGYVYRGYHRLLERDVAIKLLRKDIDQSLSTDRFLREMRLGAKLSHDNIVKCEYAGCEAGRYYLVSELVHGKDIHKIVESNGVLPVPVACEILRQIATGLQYAFEQNIVHRDIKPGNVMISRNGTVKILDFGISKIISNEQNDNNYSLTTLGTTMGSVDYCAPEQWENASMVTIRSDIYSLGCLFFFMLTGHAPFESPDLNREQRMVAHFKNEIPSLYSFCENLPDGVEKCFKKMMAKKPEHRFAKPIDIAVRIEPYTVNGSLEWLAEQGDSSFSNSGTSSAVLFATRDNSKFIRVIFTKYLPPAALLLLVGYGIHYFSVTKYQSTQKNTHNTSTQTISPDDTIPLLELSNVSMAESLQFVGYSGKWWFEDIPWYLPVVRETFRSLGNTNISKQKLNELAFSFVPQSDSLKRLLDFLILNGCPTVKNLAEYEALVNVYISETETTPDVSASILHTHAVLLHRLAELTNDPELAYRTRKLYIQAAQCYESENADSSHLLRNLCLFDVAFLNLWIDTNPEDFFRQVNAIETNQDDDVAFRAELLISPAEQLMAIGQNGNDAFVDAIMLLEKSGTTSQPHPMLVAVNRRLANALSRQWKLAKAEQYWVRTQQLAVQIALSQHGNEQLSRLSDDAVRAKLALAESARYFGDLNTARFRCRDLIGGIQDTLLLLDTIEQDVTDDKQRLTEQLADAMEILADCTLFVPTHFKQHQTANSRFFINEAQTWYANAREITSDVKRKFILQCKLALLEYSNGDLTQERHNEIWQEIKSDNSQLEASYMTSRRTTEYYDIVDIFFGQTSQSNINCIRNWLDEKRLNSNVFDRYVGERLDLQLFCINSLLKEIGQQDNELCRQDIERYLDPILLQHLVSEVKMRPFLMPFYDMAIMRLKNEDLPQTVLAIRAARAQLFWGTLPKVLVVFYFPLDSSEGFAIFLPLDRQQGKRFDLGFNRQDVIDAAGSQQELKLPEDLITSINDAISQSSRIDVSWDDSVCWTLSQGKNRLSVSTLQIFSSQLPKELLWGIVR